MAQTDDKFKEILDSLTKLPDKLQLTKEIQINNEKAIEKLNAIIDNSLHIVQERGDEILRISQKDFTKENMLKAHVQFKKLMVENPWAFWGFRLMIACAIKDNQVIPLRDNEKLSQRAAETLSTDWLSEQFVITFIPIKLDSKD